MDEITVGKTLDKLRPDKAAGPDDLSPRLLAELKEELCHPVTKIMKASFDTGVVPDDWKTANVCPIFKKGSKKPDRELLPGQPHKSNLQIVRNSYP